MVRLGSPGEDQLDILPGNVTGIPSKFQCHPFWFIDFKQQAQIWKQAAKRTAARTSEVGKQYYMDFGFMRASCSDYRKPNPKTDRVVQSWDGYSSYLLIVDEASCFMWVVLTKSKDPPLDIIDSFLKKFGHHDGGSICSDQGGELAKSSTLANMVLRTHNYVFEPTGVDSPSQNVAVETYNDKLAVRTRALLYGADLPAKYWSSALLHAVYLNKCLVHTVTKKTPFEGFYGNKPDIKYLKMFGSCVCVKQSGDRRSKLDCHDFTGIFLGYTASDHNIRYLDMESGLVKSSHHAVFDEAWCMHPKRPPAAQLLYDLGFEAEDCMVSEVGPDVSLTHAMYPISLPMMDSKSKWEVLVRSLQLPLPLWCTALPGPVTAAAAGTVLPPVQDVGDVDTLPL
jgi:hypothetical protein